MKANIDYEDFSIFFHTQGNYDTFFNGHSQGHEERDEILSILRMERIRTVFQPIFNLHTGEVYAYEALTRITGDTCLQGPEALFQAAQRLHLTREVECLCRSCALKTATNLGMTAHLSLNVCPSVFFMEGGDCRDLLPLQEELFPYRDAIILELTENCYIQDAHRFRQIISRYKKEGFRIAIDDLGAGFAGLKMLAELEPGIVKIDRFLVSDLALSTKKRMLVESIVSFCHKINAQVVAEGIETPEDLEIILSMNVDLAQGFFLGRPAPSLEACLPEAKALIVRNRTNPLSVMSNGNKIGALAQHVDTIPPSLLTENLIQMFQDHPDLTAVPVVNDRIPVGIVHKSRLFYKLGQQFGYSVYSKRSVEKVMEPVLVFEWDTSLEHVSEKVLQRDENFIYDTVIVVRHGVYLGIVKIHLLYEQISQERVLLAMQANPLTGLPGNNLIKEEIVNRLQQNQLFAVLYFDLDNFKPFNDHFGFEQGDRVIRFLSSVLRDSAQEWDLRAFLGHIGGDDFVMVSRPQDIETLCRKILDRFAEGVKEFHDPATIDHGFYESVDRSGQTRQFPLLSLSIGVLNTVDRSFTSYGHLVSVASEVKKKAKSLAGNSFFIDQRKG